MNNIMDGEEMALSGEVRNEEFINLRISREEFLHLRSHLFHQVATYYLDLEDDEVQEEYDKEHMEALGAIFERMNQVAIFERMKQMSGL